MKMARRLLYHLNYSKRLVWKQYSYRRLASNIVNRFLTEGRAKVAGDDKDTNQLLKGNDLGKDGLKLGEKTQFKVPGTYDPELVKDISDDDEASGWKWKLELAWLYKALEPALHLYKWASTPGSNDKQIVPPSTRSLAEVFTRLQLSKTGIQDWSLSDLTVGLYLIYLSQASAGKVEDFKGVQITSDVTVIS